MGETSFCEKREAAPNSFELVRSFYNLKNALFNLLATVQLLNYYEAVHQKSEVGAKWAEGGLAPELVYCSR